MKKINDKELKSQGRPFAGIRVLELTQAISGPLAGLLLADLGAEVIKVERPKTGEEARYYGPNLKEGLSIPFLALNRNKKGMTLDLKTEKGKEILLALAKKCDVLLENFTPGTMAKLGLGYREVSAQNPLIIYCSISAYGQEGPLCRQPGYEAVMQAFTGIMSVTGEEKGEALRAGVPILDSTCGALTALAISSALFERGRRKRGRYLDLSVMDSAAGLMLPVLSAYFNLKVNPRRMGNRNPYGYPAETFRTATKNIMIFVLNDQLWRNLCQALGKAEWIEDQDFKTNRDRLRNRERLKGMIEAVLRQGSAEEWIRLLQGRQIPCSPIHEISDFVGHDQFKARNYKVTVNISSAGKIPLACLPLLDEDGEPTAGQIPPPEIGEHNHLILKDYLGFDEDSIKDLAQQGII